MPADDDGRSGAGRELQRFQRADARRNVERIIDAATELFSRDAGASMAEVAQASGLVRATVYRHFPTREHLIKELLRRALDAAEEAIASAELERGPAPEAMRRLIDALLRVGTRFRIVIEAPVHDEQIMERGAAVGAPIVALTARGQREGSLRDDLPAQWLAGAAAALITESLRAVARGDLSLEAAGDAVAATFLEPVGRTASGRRRAA